MSTSSKQTEVKRTGSTSAKQRPVLPPPPPPGASKIQNQSDVNSLDTNSDFNNSLNKSNKNLANGNSLDKTKNGSAKPEMDKSDKCEDKIKQNILRIGHDLEPKSRHCSSSSVESGGKSPRQNFRKSRPAPPPPKPPPEKLKTSDNKTTSNVPLTANCSESKVYDKSAHNSSKVAVVNSKGNKTSILRRQDCAEQVPGSKLIAKAHVAPPKPPTNQLKSSIEQQSSTSSKTKLETSANTKPAILSPKPKIKPCAPPPPPPNKEITQNSESRNPHCDVTAAADNPARVNHVTDVGDNMKLESHVSDMSDIMKDVLGVIDRKNGNTTQAENENNIVMATPSVPENGNLTSESVPKETNNTPSNNDGIALSQSATKEDQSSKTEQLNIQQTMDTSEVKTNVQTELRVEIPQTPDEHQSISPIQKPSVAHNRESNSPRRPVKRRKTAIGLMLCCGLGRAFLRDKNSPPFELPLRTEGTLLRGNNVVQSTSLTTDLMQASNSPKKLEQSDVIAKPCNVTMDYNDATLNGVTSVSEKIRETNEIDSVDSKVGNGSKRDLIDVLCESEKPISLNKLQGDNKDLVVASSASSSQTNIDVTTRPVVHGVKLVKVEKSATFTALTSQDNCNRPSTPRLTKAALHQAAKNGENVSKTSHENVSMGSKSNLTQSSDVKLRKDSQSRVSPRDPDKVRSQSMEDLSCIVVDLDIDLANHIKRTEGYRSSFIGEDVKSKPALTRAPGEVQTLLKHSKEDGDKVYALPQPACYSDNTLKAVKLITDKYDTLERWKIRAVSFRGDGTVRKNSQNVQIKNTSPSRQNSRDSSNSEVISEVFENDVTDNSVNIPQPTEPDTSYGDMLERTGVEIKTCELSSAEMSRIRLFYGSRDTVVNVANSVVDFMFSSKEAQSASDVKEWTHAQSGVPVLVLNTGQGRRRRELTIVLADRDTSFPLFKDAINSLSQYSALSATLHTMHLSSSLMKMAAFQFHNESLAEYFMNLFKGITKDPNDDLWKVSIDTKKCKKKKVVSKVPVKGDISQPIQFDHVTSVTANDQNLALNLGEFIPKNATPSGSCDDFRHRAYSG